MRYLLCNLLVVKGVQRDGQIMNASSNDYVKTIRAVAAGSKVLPPALTNSLFTQIFEAALKTGNGIPNTRLQIAAFARRDGTE